MIDHPLRPPTAPAAPVTAVVAAFRPDDDIFDNVRRVAAQVTRVIVVDDGSGEASDGVFARLDAMDPDRVEIVRRPRNEGIAAALNAGVVSALHGGAARVLTMDQDSRIADDYVDAASRAAERLRRGGRPFAAIAAGMQSGHPVRPVYYRDRGDAITPTLEAIQSGLLIPAETFDAIGLFDESLFIDCVDSDFVARAASRGLPTYLARECTIDHPLGRTIETPGIRSTRSGRRSFAFHPAWRRYYITRNRAVVLVRHGSAKPAWALRSLAGETVQLARCLVFGPEKGRQSAAVALGLVHAALGRRGRLAGPAAAALGGTP